MHNLLNSELPSKVYSSVPPFALPILYHFHPTICRSVSVPLPYERRRKAYLLVTEVLERVDNDPEDDVQPDCCDQDEEAEIEDDPKSTLMEAVPSVRNSLARRDIGKFNLRHAL